MVNVYDVRAIPGDSAFLLDDGETSVLYDTGFAFTGDAVADKIAQILGDRSLDYILLTHSHYDHALGSVYLCRRWPNVRIVAGEYAMKIFTKPSARAVMRDLDRKFAHQCGVDAYVDLIDELHVDLPVTDGMVIEAGKMRFKAISLPGHTRCSFGYYLESERILLSSETIGVYAGEETVVPSYLVGVQMALDSIDKVEKLTIDRVLLPHYGLLDRDQTAVYLRSAKRSAIDTAAEIAAMLKAGRGKEEAVAYFKEKFYHGQVREIYPIDAMLLNTRIMVDLIEKEFVIQNV